METGLLAIIHNVFTCSLFMRSRLRISSRSRRAFSRSWRSRFQHLSWTSISSRLSEPPAWQCCKHTCFSQVGDDMDSFNKTHTSAEISTAGKKTKVPRAITHSLTPYIPWCKWMCEKPCLWSEERDNFDHPHSISKCNSTLNLLRLLLVTQGHVSPMEHISHPFVPPHFFFHPFPFPSISPFSCFSLQWALILTYIASESRKHWKLLQALRAPQILRAFWT